MISKSFKRLLLSTLSCCLLTTHVSLATINAEESKGKSKTETQVILDNYSDSLSSEEKAMFMSGNLVEGSKFYYVEPTNDSGLITIGEGYATLKTYTDDSNDARTWIPISVTLIADDGVNSIDERNLVVSEKDGTYTVTFPSDISKEAALTVKAKYATYVDVETDTQTNRLNTPYWLVQTSKALEVVRNNANSLRSITKNNDIINMSYLELLHKAINEGFPVSLGNFNTVVKFDAEADVIEAVEALY